MNLTKIIYGILGISALFLIIFHYQATVDVINSGFNAVSGTVKNLQKG